jgi:hypothetical protein
MYGELTQHTWGDKESYWIAAELANSQYAFSPFGAGNLAMDSLGNGTQCLYIVHYVPGTGEPLAVHGEKSDEGWTQLAETNASLAMTSPQRSTNTLWTRDARGFSDCSPGASYSPCTGVHRRAFAKRGDTGAADWMPSQQQPADDRGDTQLAGMLNAPLASRQYMLGWQLLVVLVVALGYWRVQRHRPRSRGVLPKY